MSNKEYTKAHVSKTVTIAIDTLDEPKQAARGGYAMTITEQTAQELMELLQNHFKTQ